MRKKSRKHRDASTFFGRKCGNIIVCIPKCLNFKIVLAKKMLIFQMKHAEKGQFLTQQFDDKYKMHENNLEYIGARQRFSIGNPRIALLNILHANKKSETQNRKMENR